MLRDFLTSEIDYMDEAIQWAQDGVGKAPEGKLLVETKHGSDRYYWRKSPQDKKGEYLGKDAEGIARKLAQKEYDERLLNIATKEKAKLEKILAVYDGKGGKGQVLADALSGMHEKKKPLVEPFDFTDEEYARRWAEHEYVRNGHSFGTTGFFSNSGQQMRSKSEVIIADALDAAGVPYRYEQALYIGGYSPVYPDFTVLNTHTRKEYVWEHLGAMDDPEYCAGALDKLNRYAVAGYLPGDKLIVTQESAAVPLDTRVVAALIERYFK